MTPDDLARLHPRLYHVTAPGAAAGVRRHGLLCARDALALLEVGEERARELTERRRPAGVPVSHPRHGTITINDNVPLSEKALERCLDDGLTPAEWLRMLNGMVFFWPGEAGLRSLLTARLNRDRDREVLVFDTRSLATAHADAVRLSPINSGSTIRRPARRGLATFTPLGRYGYAEWRRLRGGLDRVREVTVEGSVPDAANHLIEVRSGSEFMVEA